MRTISDVAASRQRPPLTKRLSARHWVALDCVAGALFGLILFLTVRQSLRQVTLPFGTPFASPLDLSGPLALLLVLTAAIAVALRRQHPVLMLGVLLVSSFGITILTGPDTSSLYYFLPVVYVLYLIAATYEHRRVAVRVLIAVFATMLLDDAVMYRAGGGPFLLGGGTVPIALCVITVWSAGYTVRQRRRYAVRLLEEAASNAVTEERLRIARELHDVVAHSMSVIAVQAGYGQYVIDSQPADAREALGAIQATSREALEEMRRMLGALRPEGAPAPLSPGSLSPAPLFPAPGLADLDRLISRTAGAGVRVDLTRHGPARELPASIDLSAYRIIQEALTNVVKHARTSSCQVLVGYGADELVLEVIDNGAGHPALVGSTVAEAASGPGPAPGPSFGPGFGPGFGFGEGGHGIIGMRERVSLLGGEFSAGPRPGYGFGVCAHIPLPASAA